MTRRYHQLKNTHQPLSWVDIFVSVLAGVIVAVIFGGFLGLFFLVTTTPRAHAHDHWINSGGHRNAAGELCCGENDCGVVLDPHNAITIVRSGYRLHGSVMIRMRDGANVSEYFDEVIPFSEAQHSQDGQFWRCKKYDGARRCFFAPPSGS